MTDSSAHDDADGVGEVAAGHPDDDVLLGELRSAITHHDSPPAHLVEGAKAAFGLRRVDEELAQLVADFELVGVRSPEATSYAFVNGDASIELDVDDGRLVGELVPGESVTVTIETADGETVTTATDARGRFVLDAPPGPFRLHTTLAGVRTVTDWFQA